MFNPPEEEVFKVLRKKFNPWGRIAGSLYVSLPFVPFYIFFLENDQTLCYFIYILVRTETDPGQGNNGKRELLRVIKLLCSFRVVSLTSFKWMKTNLLHDSAICCNRFELIAIFPTLFRKCVATINFLEYTQAFFNFWGPLSKNCPSTRFGASLPLTLREKWGPNSMFPKIFFLYLFHKKTNVKYTCKRNTYGVKEKRYNFCARFWSCMSAKIYYLKSLSVWVFSCKLLSA